MSDDRDEIEFMTASLANERMQVEAERIAWSRLPWKKKIWYGFKRYLNLKDSYPFPRWLVQSKFDKICLLFAIAMAIVVVILICYVLYLVAVLTSLMLWGI